MVGQTNVILNVAVISQANAKKHASATQRKSSDEIPVPICIASQAVKL